MKIQILVLVVTMIAGLTSQAAIFRGPAAAPIEFDALISEGKKTEMELRSKLDRQMGKDEQVVKAKQHRPDSMNADQIVASTENFFQPKMKRKYIRNKNLDTTRVSQEFQSLGN